MVTDRDQTLGGEPTMQYIYVYGVLQIYTLETYILLLTMSLQ